MARKKKASADENTIAQLLADNPGILEGLLKIAQEKKSAEESPTPQQSSGIAQIGRPPAKYVPPKPIEFFDDPNVGKAEGKWDKKYYTDDYVATERRQPYRKVPVTCGECGKNEEISEQLYSSEHTYVCSKCYSKTKR